MPADVAVLLSMLPDTSGRVVPYREEISHPALAEAEIATGTLSVVEGAMVRVQHVPETETAKIGAEVLSISSARSPTANIVPIPATLQPFLKTLRALIERDAGSFARPAVLSDAPEGQGWMLSFPDLDPGIATMTVTGCGARLRQIDLTEASGLRRTMILGVPE